MDHFIPDLERHLTPPVCIQPLVSILWFYYSRESHFLQEKFSVFARFQRIFYKIILIRWKKSGVADRIRPELLFLSFFYSLFT